MSNDEEHRLSVSTTVFHTDIYTATDDGEVEHLRASSDEPWDANRDVSCSCGEEFDTEDEGKAHLKEQAQRVTTEQIRAISRAVDASLYGFTFYGIEGPSYSLLWSHDTLDLTIYATPGYEGADGIRYQVNNSTGTIYDAGVIPVDNVAHITPDKYQDIMETWIKDTWVADTADADDTATQDNEQGQGQDG